MVAFPEGQKGAAKVFRERYRLQRFGAAGAVRVALETGAPLVPVGVVGAEEAHPVLFKLGAPARSLGLPFLPVTPTFPLARAPRAAAAAEQVGDPHRRALHYDLAHARRGGRDELLISRLTEELRATSRRSSRRPPHPRIVWGYGGRN